MEHKNKDVHRTGPRYVQWWASVYAVLRSLLDSVLSINKLMEHIYIYICFRITKSFISRSSLGVEEGRMKYKNCGSHAYKHRIGTV
jgi:hypothetical protein